jgi:hypothetical protein
MQLSFEGVETFQNVVNGIPGKGVDAKAFDGGVVCVELLLHRLEGGRWVQNHSDPRVVRVAIKASRAVVIA